ncbi:MAG: hypothetical protein L3J65_06930 [Robiginitomaculum sp.]|nr:hypothetical protein [Robiginitomaculum sp.]
MTKSDILEDIDYVKTLAEEGKNAPILGGRIGLWWGILLCIALFSHWASLRGLIPLPVEMIGLVWLAFGVVGGIGSLFLERSLAGKPGLSSVNNRVAGALWTGNTILLFVYSLSALFSAVLGKTNYGIMDTIMPIAFGLYALTAYVLARISRDKHHLITGGIALAFVPISLLLLGNPHLYLAAMLGVVLTSVIPSIVELRHEPKEIV